MAVCRRALLVLAAVGLVVLASGCETMREGIIELPRGPYVTDMSIPENIIGGSPYTIKLTVKNLYSKNSAAQCDFTMKIDGKNVSDMRYAEFGPLEEERVELTIIATGNLSDMIRLYSRCSLVNRTFAEEHVGFWTDAGIADSVLDKICPLYMVKYCPKYNGFGLWISYDPLMPKFDPYH